MNSYTITASGRFFNFLYPHRSQVELKDIALSLSNKCRWNGHCSPFFSVAEHSIFVAKMAVASFKRERESRGAERIPEYEARIMLTGLLHDAAEAYIGDVSGPLKNYLTVDDVDISLKVHEDYILGNIFDALNLHRNRVYGTQIESADREMRTVEAMTFFPDECELFTDHLSHVKLIPFIYYSPEGAYEAWMSEYNKAAENVDI